LFQQKEALPFTGKKELLEILGVFQKEMDQFIRENKIRFIKQEDVVRLFTYYYSLKESKKL